MRGERLIPERRPPAIALTFHHTSADNRYIWSDIGAVFGLTRAEAEIVKRLISGHAVDATALGLGISIETARTHIRKIYSKLGVNSREALFAAVAPFRIG